MGSDDDSWWGAAMGASIVTVLSLVVALSAVGGWNWMATFLAGAASNWAQAVGTVAAIYYSGRVARIQISAARRWDERRRLESEYQILSTIVALLSAPISVCSLFQSGWDPKTHRLPDRFSDIYWKDARASIAAIDPFSCPDPELVVHLLQVPRQLDLLVYAFGDYETAVRYSSDVENATKALERELREATEYLTTTCKIAAEVANERRRVLGGQVDSSQANEALR